MHKYFNTISSKATIGLWVFSILVYALLIFYAVEFNLYFLLLLPCALMVMFYTFYDFRLPLFLLIGTLVFSVSGQERVNINLDLPDELFMLFSTVVFIFLITKRWHQVKQKFQHPYIWIMAIIYLWSIVATLCSTDIAMSGKYIIKKIWYVIPFLFYPILVIQSAKTIKLFFTLLFVPLVIVIISVLFKYNALGFRFEDVHDPLQPFFVNHVMYGAMLSSFFPAIVFALLLTKKWTFNWYFLIGAIVLFFIAIYFSYSRAAWVAIIFAAGTYVCVRFKVMHYMMLLFYGLVLSLVFWLGHQNKYLSFRPKMERTIMHLTLQDHLMATLQGTDISSAERYYRWIAAVRMSKDHLLTGVGPNNFYEHYKNYTITAFRTWVSRNPERSTTHNYFLFMLVEQGLPAMILYGFFIFFIFYYGQKIYHKQTNKTYKYIAMTCLCMVGAIFINNFFSELIETDKIGGLFFLALAILIAIDKKTNTDEVIN